MRSLWFFFFFFRQRCRSKNEKTRESFRALIPYGKPIKLITMRNVKEIEEVEREGKMMEARVFHVVRHSAYVHKM